LSAEDVQIDGSESKPPPPYNAKLIQGVSKQATLLGIELVGLFLSVDDDEPLRSEERGGRELEPVVSATGTWDIDRESGLLGTVIRFAVGTAPEPDPYTGEFFIGAEYRATYRVAGIEDLSDEALGCFAIWNGQFNTWPYLREVTQNVATRAGLGEVLIPLLRIPGAVPSTAEAASEG